MSADVTKIDAVVAYGQAVRNDRVGMSKIDIVILYDPASATAPQVRKKLTVRGRFIYSES